MNEKLTNYLEFLENSSKFKAMDKAQKTQMLSEINELIKADALWVRNSHKDESKRRISNTLFARLYTDIKDEITAKIKEQKITIFSVFSKTPNQKYPKELKELRKRGDIDFAVAFGRGKDESGESIFATTFIVFAKSASAVISPIVQMVVRKYKCGGKFICGINRFKIYDAFDESSEFSDTAKKCDIINFDKNCEINLAVLKEMIYLPEWIKDFDFTHAKVLFYERLCDEIISANRQIIGSITGQTARSLWSDSYDINSYFKEPKPSNTTISGVIETSNKGYGKK
nr:hypothetical protein [uncultured Campylobacter sp.]